MDKLRRPDQTFIDIFAGAFNITCAASGHRIANDINPYLTALFSAVRDGWEPPEVITKKTYMEAMREKGRFPPYLLGFIGFGCSFAGKWFGGYASDSCGTNYAAVARRSLLKQKNALKDVQITTKPYLELDLPANSFIYCDPPYANTTKYSYSGAFDHETFWAWARGAANMGHKVVVSEYTAPPWAIPIWERKQTTTVSRNKEKYRQATERLFTI